MRTKTSEGGGVSHVHVAPTQARYELAALFFNALSDGTYTFV